MGSVTYILVALMVTSAIFSATFFAAWRSLGRPPHALSWSLAFLAATVQWSINLVNPNYPVFGEDWIAVNPMSILVIMLGLKGHMQRTGCTWLPKHLWPYALLVAGAIVYATVVLEHLGVASAILPMTAGATLIMSAIMILQNPMSRESVEWIAAMTITAFGIVQFVIAGIAVMQGPAGDPFYSDLYVKSTLIAVPATYVGIAVTVILMIAADLFKELKDQAIRDKLTGLLNRRGFAEHSAQIYALPQRSDVPVAIIAADLDHFKTVNDRFGHAVGDQALQHISGLLQKDRRADDLVVRMGGEEFILILPGTTLEQGLAIADALRSLIADTPMQHDKEPVEMTASFGVAVITKRDSCLEDAVMRADDALFRSKRGGRNRVDLDSSQRLAALDVSTVTTD